MLYTRVKDLCALKGMRIGELEDSVGFARGTISKWRESMPSVVNASKVAKTLGITVDELIEGLDTESNKKGE